MSDDPPVDAEDALQVAQRALNIANENGKENAELKSELKSRVEDLEEELAAVKLKLNERDEDRPYNAMSLDEKIGRVREHGFRRAANGHGKAALDYNDIMWSVFDGDPGTKHCYKLMRLAAEAPGFEMGEQGGSKALLVDAQEAKRGAAFFPENKDSQSEVS